MVVSHSAAIMTEGLPAMGSGAAEATCAVARAGTCPGPSIGSEKSQGCSEEVVPWLGLGYTDVWGSTGPGPQKQTPDEMWLWADLTAALSLTGSEPCSAPGQSDQNGSATHDQKEVARRSGTL